MEDWRGHVVNLGSWAGREAYALGRHVRRLEVRRARAHRRCCARSSSGGSGSRPSTRAWSARPSSRTSASAATPEKKEAVYQGVRYLTPEDVADCILWAVTRPDARERGRDRGEAAPAGEPGPDRPRRVTARRGADDPRGLDLLHLRRARRHRRPDDRALRERHALPLALVPDRQRRAAAAPLVRQGRVLLGRLLPAQPARRRPRAGRALDRARALRRRRDAGPHRRPEPLAPTARVRARARGRDRLRGHLRGQGATTSRSATRRTREPLPAARVPGLRRRPTTARARGPRRLRRRRPRSSSPSAARSTARRSATASRSTRASAGGCASTSRAAPDGVAHRARAGRAQFGEELARVRASLTAWRMQRAAASRDLGAARGARSTGRSPTSPRSGMDDNGRTAGQLPAAGMPWFMAVFGRDTLITCLQTLLFGPELARSALDRARRAPGDRGRSRRSTPSRERSSTRCGRGKAATTWFPRYYGTVDATPLFLVLLSEVWRWTDDAAFVRSAARAGAARARVDRPSTATSTATASSSTSGARRTGSTTSRGRTRSNSQLFADGTLADRPDRARARCRATSTTRSAGWPSSRARSGATASSPTGSTREAAELREPLRRGVLVRGARRLLRARARRRRSARSTRSRRTSATCSGAGSSADERVDAIVDRLMGEELWSGWGVRTMSTGDAGYSPLDVPQRHGLAARQLPDRPRARARGPLARGAADRAPDDRGGGVLRPPAARGLRRLPARARRRSRSRTRPRRARRPGPPARPILLAAGAARPRAGPPAGRRSRRVAPPELPSWAGALRLSGVRAFDRAWNVVLETAARRGRGGESSAPALTPCGSQS